MLGDSKAFSGFAVDDLEKAKAFYEDTLGLRTSEQHGLMTLHLAGDRPTIVYPKPGHEPASYTILNFPVDDIDAAVEALMDRDVAFEMYEDGARTTRGSCASTDRRSPGSATPPGTSCRSSSSTIKG
jgi:catechol 2,3-dioxygenase-like lactoylglutathione lyase family enzyme